MKEMSVHNFFRKTIFFLFFILLISSAQAAKNHPFAGHWTCTTAPIKIPSINKIPAGSIVQQTAYASDNFGRWTSNSFITYKPDFGAGSYKMKTTANGLHLVRGKSLEEAIQRFEIQKPMDKSSSFAVNFGDKINFLILAMMKESMQRKYLLENITNKSYSIYSFVGGSKSNVSVCTQAKK